MKVLQTNSFKRIAKKLHPAEKNKLDSIVKKLTTQPDIGKQKKGDLASVWIYKYKHHKKQILLAYSFDNTSLTLLAIGSHENFYRDLKK